MDTAGCTAFTYCQSIRFGSLAVFREKNVGAIQQAIQSYTFRVCKLTIQER